MMGLADRHRDEPHRHDLATPMPRYFRSDLPWLQRRLAFALSRGAVSTASILADEILRVEGILP